MSNYTEKSHWVADANRVSLSMPISKIDQENRLVTGFATLDNIDTSDDVVTAEASKSAFSAFRGNIREMHQPIAAGRLVNFEEQEFFHDSEFYRGIVATAYVSKGAEDTWQKVLDGTLSAFSIGGNITEQVSKFVKDHGPNGKTVRYIEKYDLIELSLVDNPANQLANVFSIVKNKEGTFIKGMVADTTVVNIFWCADDEIAKNSADETESCFECKNDMEQIGWFEKGEDAGTKTAAIVATFLQTKEDNTANAEVIIEGGVRMTNEINKSEEVTVFNETTKTEDVVSNDANADNGVLVEQVVDAPVEDESKTADTEAEKVEDAPVEPDFEKMFDDLKGSVNDSLTKSTEQVAEAVKAVEAHVKTVTESFEQKTSELEKNLSTLSESLQAIKNEREGVTKRLDALEKMTAIKKSGEVETEPEKKMQKGLWSGAFFTDGDVK